MILIDFIETLETEKRLTLESGTGKPSWYPTIASYLRYYQQNSQQQTSDLLPKDRRITMACRRLYDMSGPVERAVMDGSSELTGRERSRVFSILCFKLAKLSGMTASILIPEYDNGSKGENNVKRNAQEYF